MSTAFHSKVHLLSLPNEMLDRILCNLNFQALLKCKEVCKKLKVYIESAKETSYIIELALAGLEHNTNNTWSKAACLESLRKYQSGWEKLEWSEETTIPMLTAGMWDLYGGILAQADENQTFHFLRLPSDSRRIEKKSWTVEPNVGDEVVKDFAFDPSQDLLILITPPTAAFPHMSLYLRTLMTNENHPLAIQPFLRHKVDLLTGRWIPTSLKIMQDYIGLVSFYRAPVDEEDSSDLKEFRIWNWKTDKLELAIQTNDTRSFAFASDKHVILANQYIPDDLENSECYLVLIDFKAEDEKMKKLSEVQNSVKLCYPDRVAGTALMSFGISSELPPGWTPGKDDTSPFFVAKDERIFTVSIRFRRGRDFAFDHFIPLAAFQKCTNRPSSTRELKWSEWAPTETRLIQTSLPASLVWANFTYGSRSIARELRKKSFSALVYDFNQRACRRDAILNGTSTAPGKIVGGDEAVWKDTLETSLPFRVCSRSLPNIRPRTQALMCSGDNIILVDNTSGEMRIYTF
ncbi:hypothetical protein AGABI1DRAFT_123881 [Agaricus bisporus var. burnettii JB137-S8]|uniref:F-box domain-containing protein n=1 Tax=Agaricus bisporus var. burnettii (strain JB137-S8 / ATCC MYA-4627 / FGSC 10392) TaxID=597362 RepID=K5Y5Z6_AGABU|nr:hypothetical protein AGABI2DRAFT_114396 [Agaricus bisporus var. bisporus H97]XP_007325463.1 uncharacterized protein AGABI1DRAFT_123881 [Agaricus bisporus var. burnettii JB137-S8]EKM83555.1 hypothetical protein AGABI1DRAFT_123881 [Agaricus bisporus var. burnettii JB137-S8]EKV51676.1 hypothetical protein AGABI2DRAFT_114396 [Agaricus bisporus var. bisporus H97]